MSKGVETVTNDRSFRLRLFGEGILIGAFGGGVVAFFRWMLEKTDVIRPLVYEWIIAHGALGIAAHILLLLALAVALWQIVKTEPMTSGSGIPQIKGILLGYMSMNWLRVLVLKIIGGVLAIGAGMSLGREGPSVQIGASAGQGIGELTKRTRTETRLLITAGAGAGLAAAFNAPLAGVMFCLEELTKTFSPLVLMATVAATATATAVTHMVFGLTPVFHFDALPVMPIAYIVPLMLLGLFVGALGQTFNKGLFISLNLYQRSPLKSWQKPLVPLVAAAILGYVLPAVLGGGNKLVDTLVTTDFSVAWLIIIFVVKYLLTMVSFGSGVPGGIFLPMLVLGAVGGAIFAKALVFIGLIPADYAANFIVFGMAAYFASVVRSPITGSVLVMEMTGSFQHLMSLIAVSMAAYLAADLMRGMPVYDALLDRSLGIAKKIKAAVKRHRHLSVVEFIVGEGSDVDSHTVAEVKWPRGSLLVSVRRGDEELVPTGALALRAGDFLYVLIEDRDIAKLTAATEEKI